MRQSRATVDASADTRSAVADWTRRLLRLGLAVAGGLLFWLLLGETAYADTGAWPDEPGAETHRGNTSDAQGSDDAQDAAAAQRDAERAEADAERAAAAAAAEGERAAAAAARDAERAADEARRVFNHEELQPVGGAVDRAVRDLEDTVAPVVPAPGAPLLPDLDTAPGPGTPEALTGDGAGWLADAIVSPAWPAGAAAIGTLASKAPPQLPVPAPAYPLWPAASLITASFSGPGQSGALLLGGLLLPALAAIAYWRRFVDRCRFWSVRPSFSPD